MARFIAINMISKSAPGLPNAGADGSQKTGWNGGQQANYISYQRVKASARSSEDFKAVADQINKSVTIRSTQIAEKKIVPALIGRGLEEDEARAYAKAAIKYLYASEDKASGNATAGNDPSEPDAAEDGDAETVKPAAKKGKAKKAKAPLTSEDLKSQMLVLGNCEVDAIIEFVVQAKDRDITPENLKPSELKKKCADFKKSQEETIKALWSKSGLDVLCFGRMVTSDVSKSVRHAVRVSGWNATHPPCVASDFFTARDSLNAEHQNGAGTMGTRDLVDAVFYGNVVIELDALLHNLGGPEHLGLVVRTLISVFEFLDPSAKASSRGADGEVIEMVVEVSNRMPRTAYTTFSDAPAYRPAEAAERMRTYIRQRDANVTSPAHAATAIICRSESPKTFYDDVMRAAGLSTPALALAA